MSQSSTSAKGQKQTLIEDETQVKGVLQSQCPIVVRGAIDGEITGPSLHVSESGTVSGAVKVESLDSQGTLAGTFEAEHVQLSGVVQDKTVIRARSLEVKLASERGGMEVTFGECDLEVGEVPSKEQAVSDARTPAETPAAKAPEVDAAGDESDDGGKGKRSRRESTSPATSA